MNSTLYLLLEKNIKVEHPHVYLQDIAKLSCSNPVVLNRLRVMPITVFVSEKPGRCIMSAMDLVKRIQQKEPELTLCPLGETSFIITYETKPSHKKIWQWIKVIFVCFATFFGAAFSIMTFNTDVDVGGLFSKIYTQVTGHSSNGFTILEISYSLGIGLGVLFFFNHFGKMKITDDPTPMQVQMRLYEDNVNNTLVEEEERIKGK